MGGILQVDTIQNNNATTLITQTNSTTLTFGVSGQNIVIPSGVTFNTASATVTVPPSIITGQTAETSIAGGDLVLIYDDSATALRKMTRTNFVAGVGGVNTPAFQAYLSAFQSVSNGTWTKLQANTENFDTAGCYDNTTNYRFTPTSSGKYFVYGGITSAGSASDNQISMSGIYKNGSRITQSDSMLRTDYTSSGYFTQFAAFVGFVVDMNGSSDYLEMYGMSQKANGSGDRFDANCSKWGAYKLIE